ncbi:hypothetical protein [Pseudomonas sp. NUPR-001]|uniref:hypothetical protein n=1 Tax=Pseudomonas sp. NUPR-001 TaxID=3416058 RepID=UPI003F9847E9
MSTVPKDVTGRELKVGQRVAYQTTGEGKGLALAEIIKINPKTITVNVKHWNDKYLTRPFSGVCIVEDRP